MCRNYICFRDRDNDNIEREYLSGPVNDDPQMHRVCGVKRSEIYLDVDHVNVEDARTKEYLAWAGGYLRHAPSHNRFGGSAGRPRSRSFAPFLGHARRSEFKRFERNANSLSSLRRALRLGFRHAEGVQQSWWDGLSRDQTKAFVLLDGVGRVLRSTPAAERIFRADIRLTVEPNFECDDPPSDVGFKRVVNSACDPWNAVASGVCVHRSHGRRPYSVTAYPLVQRLRFLVPHGAAVVVTIEEAPLRECAGLAPYHKEMLGFTN